MEHRFDKATRKSYSHGVFLMSAAGGDVLLLTPQKSNVSLVQYRMIGGVLDFYFFSGPDPKSVIEQYGALVGLPTWGYRDIKETREQVLKMREANIPLEVMWNDIDLYHAVRDFTTDPVSYPGKDVRAFTKELAAKNQRYIPIVDAAIPKQVNATDIVGQLTSHQIIYLTDISSLVPSVHKGRGTDGSEYIGQVWPGYTVFPDWFQPNTQGWWTDALRNWSKAGVEFSGIWLDMNEASSFCDGSCYDPALSGPSGNITVNGTMTCRDQAVTPQKRGLGAGHQTNVNLNTPPYAIHNVGGRLSEHALATNATHANGVVELDVHNLWGLMEEKATHIALQKIFPGRRPFLISTPPVRALFFEFPNEPELFDVATQFMIGRDILVTPVLTPNVTAVSGIFPGRGSVIWRDWYTHNVVNATGSGQPTTLSAPLGHINIHIRDGSAILLHAKPGYTTAESRQGPFSLLVSQDSNGLASGSAYIDDGISYPPGPSRTLTFEIKNGKALIAGHGLFHIQQRLSDITLLGVAKPTIVSHNGKKIEGWKYLSGQQKLLVRDLNIDLNGPFTLEWR
ncbi:hypothetical protein H0H81_008610 [Sphagnurus paluster]|uniref:Glycoside hydrolase family 31 n=1 Tax=Sphagnurus paluster TaxID=117069 RepID=A0A9P7GIV1_9AGAR|nr:hypothetical protein H0H81_008610 [Sphagnurus paluster]